MIVDDEPLILELGRTILSKAGYRVSTCQDPAEALARYRDEWVDVDLVILDMNMPKLNGRDLFLRMRHLKPQLKAILSSGFGLDEDAQGILALGFLGFMAKPFHGAALVRKVEETLAL